MAAHFTAIFDACVLYPAPLRDLLLQLATTGLFRAKWSADIHDEWISAVLRERKDLKRAQLERTRELMDAHTHDCVVAGYQALIASLQLPDPNDRHVLAAAIRGRADLIVTMNLADFPSTTLATYDIEAQHPDDFLAHLIDLAPQAVCVAARVCRGRLKNPPITVEQYLAALERLRLPQAVAFLGENRNII
ncbi:MAG: PIN domain-containing protein [Opitutaceae bacterium]|nr:PIN domain-containing protein [Opitutaceae bacterium]